MNRIIGSKSKIRMNKCSGVIVFMCQHYRCIKYSQDGNVVRSHLTRRNAEHVVHHLPIGDLPLTSPLESADVSPHAFQWCHVTFLWISRRWLQVESVGGRLHKITTLPFCAAEMCFKTYPCLSSGMCRHQSVHRGCRDRKLCWTVKTKKSRNVGNVEKAEAVLGKKDTGRWVVL